MNESEHLLEARRWLRYAHEDLADGTLWMRFSMNGSATRMRISRLLRHSSGNPTRLLAVAVGLHSRQPRKR